MEKLPMLIIFAILTVGIFIFTILAFSRPIPNIEISQGDRGNKGPTGEKGENSNDYGPAGTPTITNTILGDNYKFSENIPIGGKDINDINNYINNQVYIDTVNLRELSNSLVCPVYGSVITYTQNYDNNFVEQHYATQQYYCKNFGKYRYYKDNKWSEWFLI